MQRTNKAKLHDIYIGKAKHKSVKKEKEINHTIRIGGKGK